MLKILSVPRAIEPADHDLFFPNVLRLEQPHLRVRVMRPCVRAPMCPWYCAKTEGMLWAHSIAATQKKSHRLLLETRSRFDLSMQVTTITKFL